MLLFMRPDPRIVDGAPLEPVEEIQIDVDDAFIGEVMGKPEFFEIRLMRVRVPRVPPSR